MPFWGDKRPRSKESSVIPLNLLHLHAGVLLFSFLENEWVHFWHRLLKKTFISQAASNHVFNKFLFNFVSPKFTQNKLARFPKYTILCWRKQ